MGWFSKEDPFEINGPRDAEDHWLSGKASKKEKREGKKQAKAAGEDFHDWLKGF